MTFAQLAWEVDGVVQRHALTPDQRVAIRGGMLGLLLWSIPSLQSVIPTGPSSALMQYLSKLTYSSATRQGFYYFASKSRLSRLIDGSARCSPIPKVRPCWRPIWTGR